MKKSLKLKILSIALILTSVILLGIIYAYFTDGDTVTNTFTVGKVSLKLEEPSWTPPKNITPNQEIAKDPQITNDGINEEFVFLEVKVPYKNLVVAADDGTKQAVADTELFSYTINPGWAEVGSPVKDDKFITHLYAYSTDGNCTSLKPNEVTPTLFDFVKFCNAIEDQGLEDTIQEIIINAYGIQTNNINGGKTTPTDVWKVVKNQNPNLQDVVEAEANLMKGEDFNQLLKSNFPTATSIEFIKNETTQKLTVKAKTLPLTIVDFSEKQDESILGWQDGDIIYISSNKNIMANVDCSWMFYECKNLERIKFNNFNTSNVENMTYMFAKCSSLTDLDLSNFDISKVTNMRYMFNNCINLISLNLKNANTSNVENMSYMFAKCSSLTNLDLSNFDTSKVTNMGAMFVGCSSLTDLDLSNFDISKVTNMFGMFNACQNLSILKVSKTTWIINKNTDTTSMWSYCKIQEPTHYL